MSSVDLTFITSTIEIVYLPVLLCETFFLSHIDEERKSDSKKPFQFLKYISSRLQSSTLRLFFAI